MPGTVQAVAAVKPRTKSEKTRLRILDAAAKTFRDKGYSATRLADIAAAADTQAGEEYRQDDRERVNGRTQHEGE